MKWTCSQLRPRGRPRSRSGPVPSKSVPAPVIAAAKRVIARNRARVGAPLPSFEEWRAAEREEEADLMVIMRFRQPALAAFIQIMSPPSTVDSSEEQDQ